MKNSDLQSASEIVIFGALGDLSRRKLLPALYQLDQAGLLNNESRILGVARQDHSVEEFTAFVVENLTEFVKEGLDKQVMARFITRLVYQQLDFKDTASYSHLATTLKGGHETRVYYFSTPPAIYGDITDGLKSATLITDADRVVMEKPIGNCLASSKVINDQVSRYFNENQIYRIDHYLGKETVLNLLVLRFANSLFTNNWDRNSIDHVQITVAESVGIEGRWGFYDDAGQMRDMIQNHLLQILSLLAMEPPADLSAESIRAEKLKAVKALVPINRMNVKEKTVRGQYADGYLNGLPVPGYLNEEDANQKSDTETFVAIKAEIDNWRWAGVPFYLRTGKRMPAKHSEIVVQFKPQAHNIFKESHVDLPANKLTIRLQPDEGVELQMMNKIPGIASQMHIQENKLDLSFSETYENQRVVDAYERLMLEVINGNQSLFVSRDEVEAAWTWADSIIEAWQTSNEAPKAYPAGTWGPVASLSMIARDDRQWVE
ncbi:MULTISPECIES: glucose-6-phosphate dehydrogenase [unclassified Colwellia]|uniref:glucose-6-phosphate dehydrogenase n=1 Tax=unclassified Colwellia TaxID=196834 RepID=UPI0015F54200|nr:MULTISPECIES: glucose-6-phosphate dehydrogenase [unclassified Colwellia]MBA6233537.1 glucose-6-phosphate dehydrogenase [Colwellia sp. MB02u-7]MBA6238097.1 glucose-6-phosphate dehydrogenase [Colwellia sp. MB02u-11]MBA6257326.1 glucose-6-phosphate dehydrogenase [Colwellia sp. MB3u-28]MBA6258910.1 glucose-6-phosphate dehydrogenase [Colwellia sp. MB3u-41]MBA6299766.1 glucose-6-phosphate dehydrogenase [Colwellia sp. MB3u-22]